MYISLFNYPSFSISKHLKYAASPQRPKNQIHRRGKSMKKMVFEMVQVREDTQKKVFFLVAGPLRFYPPYTNGLVVHATFFFFLFLVLYQPETDFDNFSFSSQFLDFREKKSFFAQGSGGFTLPTLFRPLKKTFFYVRLPLLFQFCFSSF